MTLRGNVLCSEDQQLVDQAREAFTEDHRYLESILRAAHQVRVRQPTQSAQAA